MKSLEIKRQLLSECIGRLEEKVRTAKEAMDEAQQTANAFKGAMESRYDTFKEEAQALRNGFARKVQEVGEILAIMRQVNIEETDVIGVGSVIETDKRCYFVSTGIVDDEIEIDGRTFHFVGFRAPIVQAFRGIRPGETVELRGAKFKLIKIW